MKINEINVFQLLLPFSGEFAHSVRKRNFVKNIIVEIIADQGKITGYGEGAPRSYVTGETQESAADGIRHLIEKYPFPWELNDIIQIWDFVDSLPDNKNYNSAICALETGLLGILARKRNESVTTYCPSDFCTDTIYYGAAIPLGSGKRVKEIYRLINEMKVKRLRLKMGKNLKENTDKIGTVKRMFGDDCDLRIDVNGVWNRELAFAHIPLIKRSKVKVIEQPMPPDDPDISEFADEMQKCGVIMMADELACTKSDVERIINDGHYKMINVRLSKCGGLRRSLDIIELIRSKGISFQIGCQLGESGILSAAGRVLCLLCRDAVYYDGSYDPFLLKENITTKDVSFGVGGKAGPLEGPGLGVEVNRNALERLSDPDIIRIKNPN